MRASTVASVLARRKKKLANIRNRGGNSRYSRSLRAIVFGYFMRHGLFFDSISLDGERDGGGNQMKRIASESFLGAGPRGWTHRSLPGFSISTAHVSRGDEI